MHFIYSIYGRHLVYIYYMIKHRLQPRKVNIKSDLHKNEFDEFASTGKLQGNFEALRKHHFPDYAYVFSI